MVEDKPSVKKLFYEYLQRYGLDQLDKIIAEGKDPNTFGFWTLKEYWDEHSKLYDSYYDKTLGGMIDDRLFWEILGLYLPKNRDAKILEAGGGTGRKTLPLAKMGYKITLSDLSSGMLNIAKEKLRKENLLGKVKIIEADVADLPFQNESFDFVLCVGGPLSIADSSKAASELVRVLKKKGKIFVDATSRYYLVLQWFKRDPGSALSLAKKESFGAFSPKELRELFQRNGIKVIGIYGYGGGGPGGLGILDLLPGEIIKAKEWSDETFSQLMELMRYLNKEPSILGIAGSPILVGEKI